jgi:RNA polymerase sigma-70 factor (ECF subfamily)
MNHSTSKRPQAFDDKVLEYVDLMYAVALKLTRNPQDAHDLTQNSLVKAFRFHHKFQEGTYMKAWLLTIVRNTFINDYRQKVRRPSMVELSGSEVTPDTYPERSIQYRPKEERYSEIVELLDDKVRFAVESLPEDFRSVVIKADLEDKSYKQISSELDCPMGTVMSRLFRGRKLLREKLHEFAQERGLIPHSP